MANGDTGLGGAAIQTLRCKRAVAQALPEPGVRWRSRELDQDLGRHSEQFRELGIIRVVDQRPYLDTTGSAPRHIYETTPEAHRYIEEHLGQMPGPCPHGGIRCVEAGERYSCAESDCDVRFGRETAEKRLEAGVATP